MSIVSETPDEISQTHIEWPTNADPRMELAFRLGRLSARVEQILEDARAVRERGDS